MDAPRPRHLAPRQLAVGVCDHLLELSVGFARCASALDVEVSRNQVIRAAETLLFEFAEPLYHPFFNACVDDAAHRAGITAPSEWEQDMAFDAAVQATWMEFLSQFRVYDMCRQFAARQITRERLRRKAQRWLMSPSLLNEEFVQPTAMRAETAPETATGTSRRLRRPRRKGHRWEAPVQPTTVTQAEAVLEEDAVAPEADAATSSQWHRKRRRKGHRREPN